MRASARLHPFVLQEHAHEWFDMDEGQESPYMLLVAPVLERHRSPLSPATSGEDGRHDPDLRHRVNIVRSIGTRDDACRLQRAGADGRPGDGILGFIG